MPRLSDTAFYFGTSGSTAASKIVAQTFENVSANTEAVRRLHGFGPGTVFLGCLPIHHVNGLHFTTMATLWGGAHAILLERFNPRHYADCMRRYRPHLASVVPSLLELLLCCEDESFVPSGFRYFVSAAAPLSAATCRQVLTYDRHHRPDFRVFESPLYDSELYDEGAQSLMLGQFAGDDARPFIFSTPRLERPDSVDIQLPFRSSAYDSLFDARIESRLVAELEEELEISDGDRATFRSLFTEQAPQPRPAYQAPEPRVRYFGHACALVEASSLSILIDPVIPYAGDRGEIGCFTFRDLPDRIGYVLITHGHHDHISLETLMQLRRRVGTVVVGRNVERNVLDPSLRLLLQRQGFRHIHELSEFEHIDLDIGTITGLPFMGEHHDLGVGSKLCYHLRINGRSMMFAADSCNFGHCVYERACRGMGALDALFIGMECDGAPVSWVYGPSFTKRLARDKDRSRRGRASDCKEVLNLLANIDCKSVYVYAMGSEPWIQYILDVHYTDDSDPIVESNRLISTCRSRGIFAERLHGATEPGVPSGCPKYG